MDANSLEQRSSAPHAQEPCQVSFDFVCVHRPERPPNYEGSPIGGTSPEATVVTQPHSAPPWPLFSFEVVHARHAPPASPSRRHRRAAAPSSPRCSTIRSPTAPPCCAPRASTRRPGPRSRSAGPRCSSPRRATRWSPATGRSTRRRCAAWRAAARPPAPRPTRTARAPPSSRRRRSRGAPRPPPVTTSGIGMAPTLRSCSLPLPLPQPPPPAVDPLAGTADADAHAFAVPALLFAPASRAASPLADTLEAGAILPPLDASPEPGDPPCRRCVPWECPQRSRGTRWSGSTCTC